MRRIGILGCGWLGLPLAKLLLLDGYKIKGTSTSPEKKLKLSKLGVESFYYLMGKNNLSSSFFESLDTLVITIPFIKRGERINNLYESINQLISQIESESIKNIIYLSSISVYDSLQGIVDESFICNPKSFSGISTLKIEKLFNQGNFITTIIRLGGLIGEDRNPIYSLSGKEFDKGNELINLIHQDDAIGIIQAAIKNISSKNLIYNAVAPFHPTKKDYYSYIASRKKILPPIFIETKRNKKVINSKKVIRDLNYIFKKDLNKV